MKTFTYLFITFSVISTLSLAQTIYYVDISQANDNGNGLSWGNAKKYLQSGLAIASSGYDIFVAEGTYYPDEGAGQTNDDITSTFQMITGVDIYGGFPTGGGTRDPSTYVSTLSGDLDQSGTRNSTDALHVVKGANTSTLDGFTIKLGNAIGSADDYFGAGMFNSSVSPTINNCIFTDNYSTLGGAGMRNKNSSPTITNCEFSSNLSNGGGAGILNDGNSSLTISNCDFLSNTASGHGGAILHNGATGSYTMNVSDCIFDDNYSTDDGGAVHHNYGDSFIRCTFSNNSGRDGGAVMSGGDAPVFTNCVFLNNTARSEYGGGINAYTSIPTIKQCTFSGNTAPTSGDGFTRYPGTVAITITNSIFWGSNDQISGANITVTYSDVQYSGGTYTGTGNMNSDPLFTSSTDLHLTDSSPCIGAGTDLSISDDRDGNTRPNPVATNPDMGAYENSRATPLPVELSLFSAIVKEGVVVLNWKTETEVNNYGFEIERASSKTTPSQESWQKIGFVEGHGNSNSPKEYNFIDNDINQSGKYYYRLKQVDNDGTYEYSEIIDVEIGSPDKFSLEQNYPNPFNPSTKINYMVKEKGLVRIKVYDVLGYEVATLVNEEKAQGIYSVNCNGNDLPSGVYIYIMRINDFTQSRKMLLIK